MDRSPAAGNLIQRGEFAGGQGWCDETRPVGNQKAQAFGMRGSSGGEQETVGSIGKISDQDLVKAAGLRRLGEVADIAAIQDDRGWGDDLRCLPMVDHADEFDRHGLGSLVACPGLSGVSGC
jgi:hypothetical protein